MVMNKNRIKFYFGGRILEIVNPWLPTRPHDRLLRLVCAERSGRALELCTGTGYVARRLAAARPGDAVHGIDISPEVVRLGRKEAHRAGVANLTLIEGDAGDLPFPDDSFDTVFAAFGMHELPTDVRREAIVESARVLKPGGRFVAVDLDRPTGPAALAADTYFRVMEPAHARGIVGVGLVDMLVDGGFVIDKHETATAWTPTQFVVASLR